MIKTFSLTIFVSTLLCFFLAACLFLLSVGNAHAQANQPTLDVVIIETSQPHTTEPIPAQAPDEIPPIAIGEIITFEVTIAVPNGTFPNVVFEDRLDRGLAFVAVDGIEASANIETSIAGGFARAAKDAVIRNSGEELEEHGRRLQIDLGNLSSTGSSTIRLIYGAIAINSDSNHNGDGSRRGNQAQLLIDGSPTSSATAEAVIVEPFLNFTVTADPQFADPGDTVRFALDVAHLKKSNATAMDVQANIVLPDNLAYVPNTLRWLENGRQPARINDSDPSSLRVVWFDISTRKASTVEFLAVISEALTPGHPLEVPIRATWTSLPRTTKRSLSLHNELAVERTGNSSDIGGAANSYRVRKNLFVSTPFQPAIKTVVATSVEQTGLQTDDTETATMEAVAIGEVVRYRLAMRLEEGDYSNLKITENLPQGLAYIGDNSATIAFVANERGIKSPAIDGGGLMIEGNTPLAKPIFTLPAATIIENGGDPSIDIVLGDLQNLDSDGDAEYIVVEFNALVLNQTGNDAGGTRVNTFTLSSADETPTTLTSNEIPVQIVEPTLAITNQLTTTPTQVGDLVQYQITVHSVAEINSGPAYDIVITDALDASLIVQDVRVDPDTAIAGTATVERGGTNHIVVKVDHMLPGDQLTFALEAVVSDAIVGDVIIPNQAALQYASIATQSGSQGGGLSRESNPTGSSPADGTQRIYTQNASAETFFIGGPTGRSQITLTNRDALTTDADGDGQASSGDTVRYTVEIENNGAFAVENLVLLDHVPPGAALLPNTIESTGGRIVTQTLTIGPLAADAIDAERTVAVEFDALQSQQKAIVTFDVRLNAIIDQGIVEISNQAIAFGDNITVAISDDPDTLARDDATVLLLTEAPRLSAIRSLRLLYDEDGDGLPTASDIVEHQIIVANEGTGEAPGVVVNDLIDLNIHVLAGEFHSTKGALQLHNAKGSDTLHADLGTLVAGERVTITFRSRINNRLLETVQRVSNQAIISSKLQPPVLTDDPNTPTPEDVAVLSLSASPALQSSMIGQLVADRDQNGFASVGDVVAYRVIVANSGQEAATGVSFSNTLPAFTTVVSGTAQASNGGTIQVLRAAAVGAPQTIQVEVGELHGGSNTVVSFLVEVDADAPGELVLLENQGTVQSNQLPELLTDSPIVNGQTDPTIIVLDDKPHLVLTMRDLLLHDDDGNRILSSSDKMIYLLNVINIGNAPVSDLILEDLPHSGTEIVAGTVQSDRGSVVTGNLVGSQQMAVGLSSLPAGNRAVAAFQVMLTADAQLELVENQAMLTFNDPNLRTQNSLNSDDPDTRTASDPTVTLVFSAPTAIDDGVEPDARIQIYLPITLK